MDSSRREDDRPRRRPWELLLLLLALSMSLACVFFSTWLALRVRPDVLAEANMLSKSQADYRRLPSEETPFAPLDPAVGAEAATDVARLARTPVASATPVGIVLLPPTPTATTTPTFTPTPSPTSTPTPTQTSVPAPTTSPVPTATDLPTPTSPRPTATPTAPPTATAMATRVSTPTREPTGTPIPTPTPAPTDTAISTSTAIPTDTPVPTPTDTPVPTSTQTPVPDTPTPTPAPTEVRPVVQSIRPNTMVNTDTVTVTITGLNFQTGCSVSLGSVPLVVSSCTPTTTVAASVPVDILAGYYGLTITNPDSRSGTLPSAYTATNPIPLVTAITPAVTVTTSSALAFDVGGDFFRNTGSPGGLRAELGAASLADLTFVSSTTLTATVPASSSVAALGAYTLTVTNPGPTDPAGSLINAFTVYTYTETCDPLPGCSYAVGPDEPSGTSVDLSGSEVITIEFGVGNGITDGSGYDMLLYEWPNPDIGAGVPGIRLDFVRIELSEDGIMWYKVFEWDGDPPGATDVAGTNIDGYADDADGEVDNEPIPWYDLYTVPLSSPHNSGIAIDIGTAAQAIQPPQGPLSPGPFRWVRVSVPPGGIESAQIDAIVRLN